MDMDPFTRLAHPEVNPTAPDPFPVIIGLKNLRNDTEPASFQSQTGGRHMNSKLRNNIPYTVKLRDDVHDFDECFVGGISSSPLFKLVVLFVSISQRTIRSKFRFWC